MAVKKVTQRRGRERRGSERADAKLSMRLEAGAGAGSPHIVTESQNISSSGIYCLASHYLAPLSKVMLTIVLPRVPGSEGAPQELLKCDSIVVRCDQRTADRSGTPYELACMFTGLAPDQRRRVEEFVTWRNLQALRAAVALPARDKQPVTRGVARKKITKRPPSRARAAKPARAGKAALAKPARKRPAVASSAAKRKAPKPAARASATRVAKKPAKRSAGGARR